MLMGLEAWAFLVVDSKARPFKLKLLRGLGPQAFGSEGPHAPYLLNFRDCSSMFVALEGLELNIYFVL